MATRPSPRSRDGTRPRSTSGRPPSSPRSSDSPRQPARTPVSASPLSDKTMPSFLRPTVSSSMHSSSSTSSSSSSSSKGPAVTPKRDKAPAVQPVGAPRPITPKDKAKAPAASTSRWSAVSPRQLIQRASNAIKGSKSGGKKSKEVACPATLSSGKEGAGASAVAKTETARSVQSVEEQQHQPPETTTAQSPPGVQAEEVVQPKAEQKEHQEATPQEIASTDVTTEEQVITENPRGEAGKEEAVDEEKVILEESEAVKIGTPELEEKPETSAAAEKEEEVQKNNAEDELPPPAAVVEAAANESATPNGHDEPATSTVQETIVEETKAEERQQEESLNAEEVTKENSETSVISEEPKERAGAMGVTTEKKVELAGEAKMVAASRALSEPAASLEEALEEVKTMTKAQVSTSEPASPAKEGKEKAAINSTPRSASEPATPVKGAGKKEGTSMARIPEEAGLAFKGISKVKTAMEKRSDEEQPKKKEVARSNDVIEEAKSKLLEKRKSKVKALVGAFETVMDSPGKASPGKSS